MKKNQHLVLRTFIYSLIIIFISMCWYFGNIPLISNYLHDIENKTYDILFVSRHKLNLDLPQPKNILIIGIDASSINKVGIPWPWPRQFHASLIDALVKAHAKTIVFDIIFDTISPLSLQTQDIKGSQTIAKSSFNAGKEDDEYFATSITKAMNVLLACEAEPFSTTKYQPVLPITTFFMALNNNTAFLGNSSVKYDRDNFVRKGKLIFPEFYDTPGVSASLALRVAQQYLHKRAKVLPNHFVQLGEKFIPNEFFINYYGPSETITTIPFWKALEMIYKEKESIFKDKIIYIGRTKLKASIDPFKSIRAPDTFATPFSYLTPNFSGVELQTTILGNILDNNYIVKINNLVLALSFIALGLISASIVLFLRTRLISCFYISLFLSFIYIAIAFILFIVFRISIPPTYPTYGLILPLFFINFLDQYFIVDRERRRQGKIFRQLVPSQIADEIEGMDQEQLALGGTKREITILFTDIENFTGLCEKYPPEIIVNILNQFFTEMVKIIHKHNGLVDKFIGDAIMALWGSPKILDNTLQAKLACDCALSMKQELKNFNQLWQRFGLKEAINIRIGINTDEAITGNVGSPQRVQFSAIGDSVNTASRLETVNKVYGTTILLSEKTAKLLDIDNSFSLREIDTVLVPGKDTPLNIYELIHKDDIKPELINKYSLALNNYRKRNFNEAIKYWEECIQINPSDKPSHVMLKRTLELNNSTVLENWKPIWSTENK